jgi:hypothetical protein
MSYGTRDRACYLLRSAFRLTNRRFLFLELNSQNGQEFFRRNLKGRKDLKNLSGIVVAKRHFCVLMYTSCRVSEKLDFAGN